MTEIGDRDTGLNELQNRVSRLEEHAGLLASYGYSNWQLAAMMRELGDLVRRTEQALELLRSAPVLPGERMDGASRQAVAEAKRSPWNSLLELVRENAAHLAVGLTASAIAIAIAFYLFGQAS